MCLWTQTPEAFIRILYPCGDGDPSPTHTRGAHQSPQSFLSVCLSVFQTRLLIHCLSVSPASLLFAKPLLVSFHSVSFLLCHVLLAMSAACFVPCSHSNRANKKMPSSPLFSSFHLAFPLLVLFFPLLYFFFSPRFCFPPATHTRSLSLSVSPTPG